MSGALDDGARATVAVHLDTCDECRLLVSTLAREAVGEAARTTLALDQTLDPSLLETAAASERSIVPTSRSTTSTPAEGRRFGRYAIQKRLGAGAMGVVYLAEDPELGRKVALKQLHRPDPMLTERLVREARSMAKVNHPNVVGVYDVGVVDDSTYIAMELVEGRSLRDWQRHPNRGVDEIVEAYLGAGRGLAAAHAAGIVHRDFKPDNVLVGDDGRVRVTDFGLAAVPKGEDPEIDGPAPTGDLSLTSIGQVLGTPAYMAPEQFTGGNVDSRTDQFNFCVALYEALYAQRPFDGRTFSELADHVCDGKLRPAPAKSTVSRALHAIVMRGLAVKPGDRFASMDLLLVELGRDRARPWRRIALIASLLGAVLALGLVADFIVRSRVTAEIDQAFAATGKQVDRAFDLLTSRFDANANQVYGLPVMRDVAGNHDQADFGLGDDATDQKNLADLHEKLASQDWKWVRQFGKYATDSVIAVADYKGRMLYTSADPDHWKQDLVQLPWVKRTLDAGKQNGLVLVRADDPRLAATGMLGKTPTKGLVFFFTRTLLLNGEASSQLFQVLEAVRQIDAIRLDDETLISFVAPDRTAVGDLSPELVALAPLEGRQFITHDVGAVTYDLQTIPLSGTDGDVVGHVVLAHAEKDVLSLFPHARLLFALALGLALALAIGTSLRARQITHARV